MSGNINVNATRNEINGPDASAIFNALAEEKCLCELKEAIGIPQTWESYDIRMLEDLNAIESRTANGYKYYSLTPSRALWYIRRSMGREEPVKSGQRQPVKYESAVEWLRQTMPRLSEYEGLLRRGF
jgi:hypothetical protein